MYGLKNVAGMCKVKTSAFRGKFGVFRLFLPVLDHLLLILDLCNPHKGLERCFRAFLYGLKTVAGMQKVETSAFWCNFCPFRLFLAVSGCFGCFLSCAGACIARKIEIIVLHMML